jgi:hypothetical protein
MIEDEPAEPVGDADAMDELVAEGLAVAESNEIDRRGEMIVREHQRQQNEDVDAYRKRRAQELHDWTKEFADRIRKKGGPIDCQPLSNLQPGARLLRREKHRVRHSHPAPSGSEAFGGSAHPLGVLLPPGGSGHRSLDNNNSDR